MSRYLEFSHALPVGKTLMVGVFATRNQTKLGIIKWLGRWRQYAFFPEPETAFNPECMKDISEEINRLQDEWRARKS